MSRFLSNRFAQMAPYTPGEQPQDRSYIKLNTNENPYPPSPKVIEAIDAKSIEKLKLYPDPEASELISALAQHYGVQSSQVTIGNGSDELLAFCFMAFCDSKKGAAFADITYGFYKVWAKLYSVPVKIIHVEEDFSIDPIHYYDVGKTIFIANPNAPTGIALSLNQIEDILVHNKNDIVVIDEAYVDFGAQSAVNLVDKYDNLVIVGTFSKSRNLAGGRLGYAISSSANIADLNMMRFSFNPYNVNRLTMLAGKAALHDTSYFEWCCKNVINTREYTVKALLKLDFDVLPSKTNFIFVKNSKISGKDLYLKLKEQGILVRYFADKRIKEYVRISIGTREEMDKFIDTTKIILEEIQ